MSSVNPLSLAQELEALEKMTEPAPPESQTAGEFEIVLGRGQLASVLFLASVIAVVFCAVSYLAGKAATPAILPPAPPLIPLLDATLAPPALAESVPAKAQPQPQAALPNPQAQSGSPSDVPVFAEPAIGAVYIQMGAVDRGVAAVFVEGLRQHGLQSFAAPGPSEKIFRVLIGPLPDPESFRRAKAIVDQLGLTTFARKYQK